MAPRLTEERAAWSAARRSAQTLHTPDELIAGMSDPDWRVRYETVDRLIARAGMTIEPFLCSYTRPPPTRPGRSATQLS
jgi:HEAT repeat protein